MKDIEEITVGDAITRGVICVDLNETVRESAEIMKRNDISGVIVTNKGEGVGVITERDIICKVVAEGENPEQLEVKNIMTSPLITIAPNASIDDAAALMRDKDIRRLVVSEKEQIIGVISEFDIVKIEPALHLLTKEKASWSIHEAYEACEGCVSGICDSCENYDENLRNLDGRLVCDDCAPD